MRTMGWSVVVAAVLVMGGAGCSDSAAEREARIREETAKAVEKVKPQIEEAGRDVDAAAKGAKEGWERKGDHDRAVDLNSASLDELESLPGIGREDARRIVAARPYRDRHELVSKKVLTEAEYERVRERVTVK
jgi:Helix-hairpin-helix motif